jgi:hypothetical protein
MIKGITSSSPFITVQGGQPGSIYVNPSSSNPGTGTIRFNGQDMEVYDGNQWARIAMGLANVEMSGSGMEIMLWAQKKMEEEREWEKKAKTNPTIADALATYRKAEDQLKVVLTLTDQAQLPL